jgi:hypothetical protein
MPVGFTEFELAVLHWFQTHYGNAALWAQIDAASLVRRNWTGVGVYVYLDVSTKLAPLDLAQFGCHWPIDGPQLDSSAIEYGGGAILWGKAGFIDCIEMNAYGGYFRELVPDFNLSA